MFWGGRGSCRGGVFLTSFPNGVWERGEIPHHGLQRLQGVSGGLDTETYFRHIDYVAQLVGPAHVGIGMDSMDRPELLQAFIDSRPDEWPGREEGLWQPMGFIQPEQLIEVTDLMLQRGYTETDVRGILGGNWLRVCRKVWKPTK